MSERPNEQNGPVIDIKKRDRLMASARQHLQAAFEAVNDVSDMYGANDETLVDLYMRIGCLHNEVANYGIKLP